MNEKRCPICHRTVDDYEMYCECGYEFGSNCCTNPRCKMNCGDNIGFCPACGWQTNNYEAGYIQGIPTNVIMDR